MIIIGYPGIGKSTLTTRSSIVFGTRYIDLESSNWNDTEGKKLPNWWYSYCKVAEDLSRQGYRVFVSCHKEVQDYLKDSDEYVILCYPDIELRDVWIERLRCRYENDSSQKNKNALITAEKFYSQHINDLFLAPFKNKCVLRDMSYILDNEIDSFIHCPNYKESVDEVNK